MLNLLTVIPAAVTHSDHHAEVEHLHGATMEVGAASAHGASVGHGHQHLHNGLEHGFKQAMEDGTFWSAILDIAQETAFAALEVTLFVLIMMLLVDFLDASSRGRLGRLFHKSGSFKQSLFSGFLGATPGCLGSFMSVSIYMRGMLTFGALMAGLIATCGDEAYIMLKLFPADAFKLFAILLGLGVVGGVVTDLVLKVFKVKQKTPMCETHGDCVPDLPSGLAPDTVGDGAGGDTAGESIGAGEGGAVGLHHSQSEHLADLPHCACSHGAGKHTHGHEDYKHQHATHDHKTLPTANSGTGKADVAKPQHSVHACFYGEAAGVKGLAALRRPSWSRLAVILPFIMVAAATLGGLMPEHNHGQELELAGTEAGAGGEVIGEDQAVHHEHEHDYEHGNEHNQDQDHDHEAVSSTTTSPSKSGATASLKTLLSGGNTLLLILLGVTGGLLLLAPENFIRSHVWGHVIKRHAVSVFAWVFGAMLVVAIAGLFTDLDSLAQRVPLITAGAAILIGLIPQSGPHIIFLTMYAQGIVSFPILLLNSIVQDGHALLPLLSMSVRDVVRIKLFKVILAVALGIGFLLAGIL